MPHTVPFYEELFLAEKLNNDALIENCENKLEEKHRLPKAEIASKTSVSAAVFILNKYQQQFRCHHKEHALELQKQITNFSNTDTRDQILAKMIDAIINVISLTNHKSGFASVCFVLVRQLRLSVQKITMEKIIDGANFSRGFLYRNSDRDRRSKELVDLQSWSRNDVANKRGQALT